MAHEVESLVEMTLLLTRVLASSFVRISSLFADLLLITTGVWFLFLIIVCVCGGEGIIFFSFLRVRDNFEKIKVVGQYSGEVNGRECSCV